MEASVNGKRILSGGLRALPAIGAGILIALGFTAVPSPVEGQFGTAMPGYSGTAPGAGVHDREQGWTAETDRKHTEILQQQREQDRESRPRDKGDKRTESVETVQARSFFVRLDMGMDPKLVEQVRIDPKGTLNKYVALLAKARKTRKFEEQRDTAVILGHVYYLSGLFKQAAANYEEALKFFREGNDLDGEALMINNLGAVSAASGNYSEALKYCQDALERFKATGNTEGQGRALNNLAVLAKNQGRFGVAVSQLLDALKLGIVSDETKLLRLDNLARTYSSWGQHQQAVDCITEAVAIARKTGDAKREADLLVSLGEIYQTWGKDNEALTNFEQALALYKSKGVKQQYLSYLIGSVFLDRRELDRAEPFLKESEFPLGLARLSLLKSDFKAAKRHYEDVGKSALKHNRPRDLFSSSAALGKICENLNDLKRAEESYVQAMEIVEDIRSALLWSERRNFLAVPINGFLPSDPAKGLIRVRLKKNQADQTILPGEVTRAREFVDHIAQRADVSSLNVPQEVLTEEERLANRLASLKKARELVPRDKDTDRYNSINAEIRTAEKELKAFQKELRTKHPAYAALRAPEPVTLETSALKPDEYVVLFDLLGDGIGIRLIKGNKIVYAAYEPLNSGELDRDVRAFLSSFWRARLREFDAEAGRRLFQKLLASALAEVPQGSRITIIPDGELALVPFEALVVTGKASWQGSGIRLHPQGLTYVGDRYSITYYQSLTAMTLFRTALRNAEPGNRLLVLADPVFSADDARTESAVQAEKQHAQKAAEISLMAVTEQTGLLFGRLPLTGNLAKQLRVLYPGLSDIFEGAEAQKSVLVNSPLSQYRSVVCATHGYYGNDIPGVQEPILVLSLFPAGTDGFLRMSEVMSLNMNADVVVLTACQTGLGASLPGEGVMSMGRAFQYAGAKSVLMSLWSVAEDSSVMLVEKFFKHMKDANSNLEALQLARAEVRKEGYEHPFFWAPFILVGEEAKFAKDGVSAAPQEDTR